MVQQEAEAAAGGIEDRCGSESDDEVQRQAEYGALQAALVCVRADDPTGNSLEDAERLGAHCSTDEKSSGDVHDATDGSGRNYGFGRTGHGASPESICVTVGPLGPLTQKPFASEQRGYSGGLR